MRIISFVLCIFPILGFAQKSYVTGFDPKESPFYSAKDETETHVKSSEYETEPQLAYTYTMPRYKLYPTNSMWIFLKLDTATGKIWMVQWSNNSSKFERFEAPLNRDRLASFLDNDINGRFELYPTQNIYNFILIDQTDGRTWQVQWSNKPEECGIVSISY